MRNKLLTLLLVVLVISPQFVAGQPEAWWSGMRHFHYAVGALFGVDHVLTNIPPKFADDMVSHSYC